MARVCMQQATFLLAYKIIENGNENERISYPHHST